MKRYNSQRGKAKGNRFPGGDVPREGSPSPRGIPLGHPTLQKREKEKEGLPCYTQKRHETCPMSTHKRGKRGFGEINTFGTGENGHTEGKKGREGSGKK